VRAYAVPAFEHFAATGAEPYFLWRTAIALAWVRAGEGRLDEALTVLEAGQRARRASGVDYISGSGLFEVLDRLEVEGLSAPDGLDLETELERTLAWPDPYMRAVAHRFRARRLARTARDDAHAAEVDGHHARSVELLRESGACPAELARALEDAARWAGSRGRAGDAALLEREAGEVLASLDLGRDPGPAGASRIAKALVELGRLASLADRADDGVWGELAARLCAILGVERCALVEEIPGGARAVAVRGGGAAWVAALEALAGRRAFAEAEALAPPATADEPASGGRLVVVPFASPRLSRRWWAFLENRHSRALVSEASPRVLEALAVQLGVVLENVSLWQELAAARVRLEQENRYHRQSSPAPAGGGRIVGDSPALREVLALVARVAPASTTVLVHGETGAGKELVAREVHRLSPRRDRPFVAVHVASLAPGLVASGLFGHERGAFTGAIEQTRGRFELADGGTLFLDEVGELGPEEQVRILRVLQEGVFERVGGTRSIRSDFRLVAATNRDLAAEVQAGRFREDLYFRLAAFPIRVPPLRERTEEIPTLALYFMEAIGRKLAVRFEGIGEADMARLVAYRWPGNVRELEHVIERAALLSEPPRLRIPPLHDAFAPAAAPAGPQEWVTLEETERRYLRALVAHTRGRITGAGGAAELAGLKPSTLTWRIDRLGLRTELRQARAERE
jgi:DNA-binding NtrC family response regulator